MGRRGVNIRGPCMWKYVCNLQRAERNSSRGDAEEGDVVHHQHHHSALVPLITSSASQLHCITIILRVHLKGADPLSSYRAVTDIRQAVMSAASLDVKRILVGAIKLDSG